MPRLSLSSALCAFAAAAAFTVPVAAETVQVELLGFEEVPANVSHASGSLRLFINDHAGTIDYELIYENLTANITQAHIHVAQAGVNGGITLWLCGTTTTPTTPGPPGTPTCPAGQNGVVTGTLTAANVVAVPAQIITAGALDDVIRAIRSGVAYGNVHTTVLPGGEIRGQLH